MRDQHENIAAEVLSDEKTIPIAVVGGVEHSLERIVRAYRTRAALVDSLKPTPENRRVLDGFAVEMNKLHDTVVELSRAGQLRF